MKRTLNMILLVLLAIGMFTSISEARLSNNNRRAVVLECFYALRPSYDGSCDKTINGNCVSNWNYINTDPNAYITVLGWYGCLSSNWTKSGDGSDCYNNNYPVSFWTSYAYYYGYYNSYGRGGQCKYFANLILYRSESYQIALPSYSVMAQNAESNLSKAIQGDILFSTSVPHTAIVVELKPTGLDVVDTNYVTDGGSNQEIIGRHLLTWSQLSANNYKIYKGISYYYEPYIP